MVNERDGKQYKKVLRTIKAAEEERHIVAQRIIRARRKATARTVQLVRSASMMAAAVVPGRSSSFIARPGVHESNSSPA